MVMGDPVSLGPCTSVSQLMMSMTWDRSMASVLIRSMVATSTGSWARARLGRASSVARARLLEKATNRIGIRSGKVKGAQHLGTPPGGRKLVLGGGLALGWPTRDLVASESGRGNP